MASNSALRNLFEALAAAPSLPGARCRNRSHPFDPPGLGEDESVVEQRHAQALSLCSLCPSLDRCREWVDSLPLESGPPVSWPAA